MDRNERIQKVIRATLTMQRWPWEQGVVAQAFLELGQSELTVLLARDAVMNQYKDGRLAMKGERGAVTDPAANGEPVLYAAKVTGDENYKKAADKMLEYILYRAPKTKDGILFHNENEGKIWVDSFYMAPPFLAITGYTQLAVQQIKGYRRILWSEQGKLYSHIWDEDYKEFTRGLHWGVGNGWAAAGMTRVIKELPEEMKNERELIIGYVKDVIDGCLKYQREDGLFHDIVDDPSTFVETNLAQMLSYSIYRGVKGGWLDSEYVRIADRMREAVYAKVDEYGLVQGVCATPDFNRPGTASEGQAFFLLMEAAYNDMA